jgi:phosphatidylglycerophosphatase A
MSPIGFLMRKCIITFCGLGLIPGMPGTYASLAAAVVFGLLYFFCPSHLTAYGATAALVVVCGVTGAALAPWAEEYFQEKDPAPFVLDEVVGQLSTLLIVFLFAGLFPAITLRPIPHMAVCFVLFRTFDVAKPWPIRRAERAQHGVGIILDDLVGTLYAVVASLLLVYVVRLLVGASVYDGVAVLPGRLLATGA